MHHDRAITSIKRVRESGVKQKWILMKSTAREKAQIGFTPIDPTVRLDDVK